jgi:hypothetical protein
MADKGTPVVRQFVTQLPVEEVNLRFTTVAASATGGYCDGVTISQVGPNALVITRLFVPGWAVAVAIIGALCAFVGLLALLYRETETLSIQMSPAEGGTAVSINGTTSVFLAAQLGAVIATM